MARFLRFGFGLILGLLLVLGLLHPGRWLLQSWSDGTPNNPPGLVKAALPSPLVFWAPKSLQGKTISQVKLPNSEKVIALTFDDGPWGKSTETVLSILEKYKAKATFFWIGQHLQNYPEVARKVVAAGHAVANHSWSHGYKTVSPTVAKTEIENTSYLIAKTTDSQTRLFRPPGGILNNGLVDYAKSKNYTTVMWSVDPHDSAPKATSAGILKTVLAQVKSGGIILLHDGGGNRQATLKALPTLIEKLQAKGYRFVTVPELLELSLKPATPVASPSPSSSPMASSPPPDNPPTPETTATPEPLAIPPALNF